MSRITTARPAHLSSAEVYAEVGDAYARREISDAAALTIASWWQSPGRIGSVLAELASTGSADVTELLDDIARTRAEAGVLDAADGRALDMLATWALNHSSVPA